MTSEKAKLQNDRVEFLQAEYRKMRVDFVLNNKNLEREELFLMRCFVVFFVLFLSMVLSGWTGFYN